MSLNHNDKTEKNSLIVNRVIGVPRKKNFSGVFLHLEITWKDSDGKLDSEFKLVKAPIGLDRLTFDYIFLLFLIKVFFNIWLVEFALFNIASELNLTLWVIVWKTI